MRTRLLVPLSLLLVVLPALQAQQQVSRRMAVDPDVSVRIVNLAGQTRVIGWDADSVVVSGAVPKGSTFYMGGGFRGVKMGVEPPENAVETPAATLEVRVPRRARVWVKSATAGIAVEGITGEVDAYSVSGGVSVAGSPSLLTAESMDGDVEIDARARVTRVKTAGGDITVRGGGGEIIASSVSGAVRLLDTKELSGGRLESVSGAVVFRGSLTRGASMDLQTHEGPIEISLAPMQGATLDISAFGGRITNAIPGATAAAAKGKPTRYSVGSGGAHLTVRSLKGDVRIRRQLPRLNPSP